MIVNLLRETLDCMEHNGVKVEEIEYIGSKSRSLTWEEFGEIAGGTNYDESYGTEKVATDLVIVGTDWWLTREQYDGSEWWEFHRKPAFRGKRGPVRVLASDPSDCCPRTLGELNGDFEGSEDMDEIVQR